MPLRSARWRSTASATRQERDGAVLRHGLPAVRVAGEGKRRICQREDEPAVTQAEPVRHPRRHGHAKPGVAGSHIDDLDAEVACRLVTRQHGLGARSSGLVDVARHAVLQLWLHHGG
jgi:hypothetical protein